MIPIEGKKYRIEFEPAAEDNESWGFHGVLEYTGRAENLAGQTLYIFMTNGVEGWCAFGEEDIKEEVYAE